MSRIEKAPSNHAGENSINHKNVLQIAALPESKDSPYGIFGAYATEYRVFQSKMNFSNEDYWDWVDAHFSALGAHWTRSNLQFIWNFIEPEIGAGYNWNNNFCTDDIARRISASPADVHWLAVFHEGGLLSGSIAASRRPPLRNPLEYPDEYSSFVRAAVERYDGDGVDDLNSSVNIKYWQVGNEYMMLERNGGKPSDYIEWVKLTSTAIKQADPEARVVLIAATQGLTVDPWMKQAITGLAPEGIIDTVDIHHWGPSRDWRMQAVPQVRSLLNELGRSDAEILSCEHGTWAGSPTGQIPQTEEEQASSLIKRYVYNIANGLDKLFWNNLMEWDKFGGQEGSIFNSMGLISDGVYSGDTADRFNTPRIAYWSYMFLTHYIGGDLSHGEMMETGSGDVYVFRYDASGKAGTRFIGWTEGKPASVTINEPGFKGRYFSMVPDRYGNTGDIEVIKADQSGNMLIELDADPILIISD